MDDALCRFDVKGLDAAAGRAQDARRLQRIGWWIILGAIVPLGLWMALAPLSMAVVAPAFVKVDLNRRPVQHLEGGIVRSVLVRDGQRVKAGDPIIILGDVGVDANRNRLDYRVQVERAAVTRLEAEQALAQELSFSGELREAARSDERVRQALDKESEVFRARRDSLASEVGLLQSLRGRVDGEISALRAQIEQAQRSLTLQRKDFDANRGLVSVGFISSSRIAQMEAQVVDYAAKLEERRSELARAEQRLVDADLKIKSAQNQYRQTASDQLKATAARLAEIEQELRKSEDAAARQVVTATANGEIIDLRFTSPGAVVRPGDAIAEIVPSDAKLMIEAHIRPEDIAHVQPDQPARIKFTAFPNRSTALVSGRITYVAADRLTDRANGLQYYTVMIAADAESLRAEGDMKLQAGMPAEVYIEGVKQTPLEYLIEPIATTLRRAGRQL